MALNIPNVAEISKRDPKLGEALVTVQKFENQNVTPVAGNAIPTPTFVTPGKIAG